MSTLTRMDEVLRAAAARAPAATAIVDGGKAFDYRALDRTVTVFADRLRAFGVAPGDRVAVFLEKSADLVVALFGIWRADAIAVPINETLKSIQVEHIVQHSGAKVAVADPRRVVRLAPTAFAGVTMLGPDLQGTLSDRGRGARRTGGAADTAAAILYTSGSTGLPKGILLSHENLVAGARIVSSYLGLTPEDRLLSVLPFSFDYGLNQLLSAVYTQASLVLLRSTLGADIARALADHDVTGLAGVPPMWIQLADPKLSPLFARRLPRLRYITNSGGVFPVELVRRYREALPSTSVFLMYGLTEAFRSTYLPPSEVDRIPDSMGRAIPETDIFVLDDEHREVAPGARGLLVHRGPTVSLGYYRDPEATAAVFRPDPFDPSAVRPVVYSGDLVERDRDGFLFFRGRRDALIKSMGFRMSPEEVEETLRRSDLLAEVVVHGRPDPVAGAVIVADVVPKDAATFDRAALVDWCRYAMPSYMVPADVRVHEALPRTSSGKIDRKGLAG